MQITRIGDFEVHRVAEYEGPFIAPETFFPDFDKDVLRSNPDHPGPRLIDLASGNLLFSFHSFVVKTGRHTILIDSCLGNDKERPTRPQFHRLRSSYLADLARAGVGVEDGAGSDAATGRMIESFGVGLASFATIEGCKASVVRWRHPSSSR